MNKTELVAEIAKRSDLSLKDVRTVIDVFQSVVGDTLTKGEDVKLVGFGTFGVIHRSAREGRNPRNPEEVIQIPAVKSPNFRAGKTLKDKVNNRI